jgi:hypothetical protein
MFNYFCGEGDVPGNDLCFFFCHSTFALHLTLLRLSQLLFFKFLTLGHIYIIYSLSVPLPPKSLDYRILYNFLVVKVAELEFYTTLFCKISEIFV